MNSNSFTISSCYYIIAQEIKHYILNLLTQTYPGLRKIPVVVTLSLIAGNIKKKKKKNEFMSVKQGWKLKADILGLDSSSKENVCVR